MSSTGIIVMDHMAQVALVVVKVVSADQASVVVKVVSAD
jgi:hypothetical protein